MVGDFQMEEEEKGGDDQPLFANYTTLLYLEEVQEQIGLTRMHLIVLASCSLAYYAVCVEMMMFVFMYGPLLETWNISGLDYAIYQATGTSFSFVSGLLCGRWADLSGRKGPYLIGILAAWVAGFASAFSPNYWTYVGLRCLVSFGLAAVTVVDYVMLAEFFPARYRSQSLIVVTICGTLGVLSCAGLAWYLLGEHSLESWRLFVLIVSTPLLVSGIIRIGFVPQETPKYALLNGNWAEAFQILCLFAASGPVFQSKDHLPEPDQSPLITDDASSLLPICPICNRQLAFLYCPSSSSLVRNEFCAQPRGLSWQKWLLRREDDWFCHCGLSQGFRDPPSSIFTTRCWRARMKEREGTGGSTLSSAAVSDYSLGERTRVESAGRESSEQSEQEGIALMGEDFLMEERRGAGEGGSGLFGGGRMKVTICLSLLWLLQAMTYWGFCSFLPKFYDEIGLNLYPQMFLMVGMELPAYVLGLFLVKQKLLGAINCLCLYFGLTFCSLLLLAVGASVDSKAIEVTMSTTSFMFLVPNYAFLYSFSPTKYPTSLRSTAMGFFNAVASLPGLITPFIGFALTSLPPSEIYIYPLAWSVCVLLAFICSFTLKHV